MGRGRLETVLRYGLGWDVGNAGCGCRQRSDLRRLGGGREYCEHGALGRLMGCLSLPPESPVVCPNCGSDHVVLLAVSGEVPNREQNQEGQSVDSACDRADHSGYPSVPDGIAPQESIAHGRSSWSLSPSEWSECGWNKVGVCLGEGWAVGVG